MFTRRATPHVSLLAKCVANKLRIVARCYADNWSHASRWSHAATTLRTNLCKWRRDTHLKVKPCLAQRNSKLYDGGMASSSGDGPTAEDAQRRILTWSKASKSLTTADTFEMGVVCEAGKRTLLTTAQDLVSKAQGGAVLASKSCDSTPMTVSHRAQPKIHMGRSA